jgi:hypothetical protein
MPGGFESLAFSVMLESLPNVEPPPLLPISMALPEGSHTNVSNPVKFGSEILLTKLSLVVSVIYMELSPEFRA